MGVCSSQEKDPSLIEHLLDNTLETKSDVSSDAKKKLLYLHEQWELYYKYADSLSKEERVSKFNLLMTDVQVTVQRLLSTHMQNDYEKETLDLDSLMKSLKDVIPDDLKKERTQELYFILDDLKKGNAEMDTAQKFQTDKVIKHGEMMKIADLCIKFYEEFKKVDEKTQDVVSSKFAEIQRTNTNAIAVLEEEIKSRGADFKEPEIDYSKQRVYFKKKSVK